MEYKTCNRCEKEYPKTVEYFFTKTYKQKLANGKIKQYKYFRHVCKTCHGKLLTEKNRKKRCKELGCSIENYKKEYIKQMRSSKLKFKELVDIDYLERITILKDVRNGYEFTTLNQYRIDKPIFKEKNIRNGNLKRRKYHYKNKGKLSAYEVNQASINALTDARIALSLGFKVDELPKEIIETKRKVIQLKRELGLTTPRSKNKINK